MYNQFFTIKPQISKKNGGSKVVHLILSRLLALENYIFSAYRFICHYSWFVQISEDVIYCRKCATDEYTFCVLGRPRTIWRHLHIISRAFQHTDLHCGRCYKLLVKTRRAINCYTCRSNIIARRDNTERIIYKLICDTIVPRGPI